MQNLARRPSGIYILRLVVPSALRAAVGKREIIISTGTRELALAKIVAGAAATQWRQHFLEISRLKAVSGIDSMEPSEIIKVVTGSPVLLVAGYLPLPAAAGASGLTVDQLLRAASEGRLALHVRLGGRRGHLVPEDVLEPVDPEVGRAGGLVVPHTSRMPDRATPHVADGVFRVPGNDATAVATTLLDRTAVADLVALEYTVGSGMWFVPELAVTCTRDSVEVATHDVENLRRAVAAVVDPRHLEEAREVQKQAVRQPSRGRFADKLLSEALDSYVTNRLAHDLGAAGEIKRVKNGCNLLIELGGDRRLGEITTEVLREFRDALLARVPASENKIRLMKGTTSVAESMAAVAGSDWPVMSPTERDKRMRWIAAWFRWLHGQRWITEDPAAPLEGESVLSKADRSKRKARRDDEVRHIYSPEDLAKIFSEEWFTTGRGSLTKSGTYRTFLPFYYWGPLIALLCGGPRVNEVSQLYLADFGVTPSGTPYVDFQEGAEDQKLKNQPSKRRVPLHPLLLSLGLLNWVEALRAIGYTRLFPELKRDAERGYGKSASKWFTRHMASRGFARDGSLTFHSFRHTFVNALPEDTPERVRKQLTGHTRGKDSHDTVYRKDKEADQALPYIERLQITLPEIAKFDVEAGLAAVEDALDRKRRLT